MKDAVEQEAIKLIRDYANYTAQSGEVSRSDPWHSVPRYVIIDPRFVRVVVQLLLDQSERLARLEARP